MKKLKLFALLSVAFGLGTQSVSAQTSVTEEDTYPYAFIGGAGGAFAQFREKGYDIKTVLTPMGAFNVGGMFCPYVGARFQLSGWKEKGTYYIYDQKYDYGFWSPNLDLMVDVTNFFYGKKPHTWHLYAIGGTGFSAGRGTNTYPDGHTSGVKDSRFAFDYRAGLQLEAKVCKHVGVFVEALGVNMHGPYKPELNHAGEWRLQGMLGLNFTFGGKNKRKKVEEVMKAVSTPAAAPTPNPAPAVTPAPTPQPTPQPQPKKEEVQYTNKAVITFPLAGTELTQQQEAQLKDVAYAAKQQPGTKVSVVGYADAGTGTHAANQKVSKKRADNVTKCLTSTYGIDAARIVTDNKGDYEQPFANNDDNRAVIVEVKK